MADQGSQFSFSGDLHITSGLYIFTYIRSTTIKIEREVDSLETNQATTGDIITLRSRDFEKT